MRERVRACETESEEWGGNVRVVREGGAGKGWAKGGQGEGKGKAKERTVKKRRRKCEEAAECAEQGVSISEYISAVEYDDAFAVGAVEIAVRFILVHTYCTWSVQHRCHGCHRHVLQ